MTDQCPECGGRKLEVQMFPMDPPKYKYWCSDCRKEVVPVTSPWQTGNPVEPGWYLVTIDRAGERFPTMAYWWGEPNGWQMLSKNDDFTPIAYQPLPEPYQG